MESVYNNLFSIKYFYFDGCFKPIPYNNYIIYPNLFISAVICHCVINVLDIHMLNKVTC